ncbi:MAG: hypothetical protein DMG06_10075 [Acidobacteria bacterium]|nr:MAG: hypothetical protein DMG06_10075 [Acidobacteriota bacterium]
MKGSIPKLASQASALLLFLSLFRIWPIIYYVLLRYLVGITAVLLIVRADEMKKQKWIGVWIGVAILFNPIVPVYLPTPMQAFISFTCGLLFALSARMFRL